MQIMEIRDLDGPNLFMMQPAIKVEIGDVAPGSEQSVLKQLSDIITWLHKQAGAGDIETVSMVMETPGNVVVAFPWMHRAFARSLGKWAAQLLLGERSDADQMVTELQEIMQAPPDADDAPLMIPTAGRTIPIVAITGTNGKTTTSRLIAYVMRKQGKKVGLTSSAGVFINGEPVLSGDYSGPSGARRVFQEPGVEIAVLETARGGMLLRGCGFENSDVSVITNVSEDHLGIHGVHTVEGLARVKEIIARVVKPGGFCVLNADDPFVSAMKDVTPGVPVLFSRLPESGAVKSYIQSGGKAVVTEQNGDIVWHDGETTETIANVADIPMTFAGLATHQIENAMAAIGGLLGLGLSIERIREGILAFKSSPEDSKGRLNLFELNGASVIVDFAHNEAGLKHLLNFAHGRRTDHGRILSVIGTAGDRDNAALRAIAKLAVERSDVVMLKDTEHYLRGRETGDLLVQMRIGVEAANRPNVEVLESPDERSGAIRMIEMLLPGDVLAIMCVEEYDFLLQYLSEHGTLLA